MTGAGSGAERPPAETTRLNSAPAPSVAGLSMAGMTDQRDEGRTMPDETKTTTEYRVKRWDGTYAGWQTTAPAEDEEHARQWLWQANNLEALRERSDPDTFVAHTPELQRREITVTPWEAVSA